MLSYSLFAFIGGYALFLLGFAVFMYFENRKFGDNQFTMKLLPPPPPRPYPGLDSGAAALQGASAGTADPGPDWTAVPDRVSDLPSARPVARPVGARPFTPDR